MILELFRHGWLGFVRSKGLGHKILEKVLVFIIFLNFAVSLAVAGLVSGTLIAELYPGKDEMQMVLGLLLLYLLIELGARFFFQSFPVKKMKPYLVLPIARSTLANSLLLRSLLSWWNVMVWFFAIPMYFSVFREYGGAGFALGFFVSVLALSLSAHFLAFAMVAWRTRRELVLIVMLLLVSALFFEFKGQLHLTEYLGALFQYVLNSGWMWVFLLPLPLVLYQRLRNYLAEEMSIDRVSQFERKLQFNASLHFFAKYGPVGELVDLEFRLILRNKRARQYFLTSIIFWLLPLYLKYQTDEASLGTLLALAFVCTGMITLNHAQLLLSWNSNHFDFMLTRGQSLFRVYLAKYYALCIFCAMGALVTLPFSFWMPGYFSAALAMLGINMSVSIYVYMIVASISSLRVDPNEGGAMSLNGFSMIHYIIVIPIILVPVALYFAGWAIGGEYIGLAFIAGAGWLLFAFHKPLVRVISQIGSGNKYRIAAALRNK